MSGTTTVFQIAEGAAEVLPETGSHLPWDWPFLWLLVCGAGLWAAGVTLRPWAGVRN